VDILNEKGIKTQKISGVQYVYKDTPYWDCEKKQNRHKRDYIGKIDDDGNFIPNKNYECRQYEKELCGVSTVQSSSIAERSYYGATFLLDCIGKTTGLTQDIETVFGTEKARKILSLAYFMVLEGDILL